MPSTFSEEVVSRRFECERGADSWRWFLGWRARRKTRENDKQLAKQCSVFSKRKKVNGETKGKKNEHGKGAGHKTPTVVRAVQRGAIPPWPLQHGRTDGGEVSGGKKLATKRKGRQANGRHKRHGRSEEITLTNTT